MLSATRMDVVSLCPLRVTLLPWQPRRGAFALTIICKATFELRPGESPLAPIQEPAWDTPLVTDLAPFKRRADVFAVGHAYPGQKNQASVRARLAVGIIDKTAVLSAEQGWLLVHAFGPLPPTSPTRTAMLGEYAGAWNHRAWNIAPLPQNIDGAYFNAAPADQQLPELAGDESIVLEWLHPVYSRLETKLARVIPQARVEKSDGQIQDVRLRCDTLCIDTVRRTTMLVWRGVALLGSASEQGRVVVTTGPQTGAGAEAMLAMTAPVKLDQASKPAVPFSQESSPLSSTVKDADWAATTLLRDLVDGKPAVPFVSGPVSLPAAPSEAPRMPPRIQDGDLAATKPLWYAGVATVVKPATPFEQAQKPAQDIASQAPLEDTAPLPEEPLTDTGPLPENIEPTVIEEPPMIGPIPVDARAVEVAESVAESAPKEITPHAEPEKPPTEISLETYAAIKAELAEKGASRPKVLESHDLREEDWGRNDHRWTQAIEDESLVGEQGLRERYDAAYVARVEAFRGSVNVDDYARIMVALERGRPKVALDALRIQHAALMPIVRRWTRMVAADRKLGEDAVNALRAARRIR